MEPLVLNKCNPGTSGGAELELPNRKAENCFICIFQVNILHKNLESVLIRHSVFFFICVSLSSYLTV